MYQDLISDKSDLRSTCGFRLNDKARIKMVFKIKPHFITVGVSRGYTDHHQGRGQQ